LNPSNLSPAGAYIPAGAGLDPWAFWESQRPELVAIRYEAARRILSPWAVLGMAITQSLCVVPVTVRYRTPMRPEGTALNLAMTLVGPPGAGKSSADPAATGAVEYPAVAMPGLEAVRSGEGIPGVFAYLSADKDEDGKPIHRTVYRRSSRAHRIAWDEVGVFGAQASRTGSTIIETVNTAATGGALGGQSSKGDGLTLEAGAYRAAIVLNAQPARAGGLVDAHALASGLTARMQWMAATAPELADAARPERDHDAVQVGVMHWTGVEYVDALDVMTRQHEHDKRAGLAGALPAEHGHRTTRGAILAIALANMAGRAVLIPEDWDLACLLLAHSDQVLDSVRAALAEPDPVDEDRDNRVMEKLYDRLDALQAEGVPFAHVQRRLTHAQRKVFAQLKREGMVTAW
jgi:hypothetical protein